MQLSNLAGLPSTKCENIINIALSFSKLGQNENIEIEQNNKYKWAFLIHEQTLPA